MMDLESFLAEWVPNGPLLSEPSSILPKEMIAAMPADYLNFMNKSDGGEGMVGPNYLILWRLSEIMPFSRDYQVETYAPGFFLIGSSGGGEAFGYDSRLQNWPIVMMPFIGMGWSNAITVGDNFNGLIRSLAEDTLYG